MSGRGSLLVLLLAPACALAQGPTTLYKIEKEGQAFVTQERQGKPGVWVTLRFKILRPDGAVADDVAKEEVVVEEDGKRVAGLEVQPPAGLDRLTAVLAVDTSGSMREQDKIGEARRAGLLFLDRLHPRADTGLILFNHLVHHVDPPAGSPERQAAHRTKLRSRLKAMTPEGGTAYLDAAARSVELLRPLRGRKAALVLTDGVDLNSRRSLDDVIRMARGAELPVYTIGVGEPGRNEPVTTVLVLDHSGSMLERSGPGSRVRKIDAMKQAASRFIDLMRPNTRATLLPFSTRPATAAEFSNEKDSLKRDIEQIKPAGETALFWATRNAVQTLEADPGPGKKAVIVLTDGRDSAPGRVRREDAVARARAARIPLHMIGFGQRGEELDEEVMRDMAAQTGGTYHHAEDEHQLLEIFESLFVRLHDDGVDEPGLRQLARETGGKYFAARDISQLQMIYGQVAEELQNTFSVTFLSARPDFDGTSRDITVSVLRRGQRVSELAHAAYNVTGVVVPEMDHRVYLVLLTVLGVLIGLPTYLGRARAPANGEVVTPPGT